MLSTFNVLEAAIAHGVRRFVNFSSETVPGFIFALPAVQARLPAGRRGAPGPAAGRVRDRRSGSASCSASARSSAPTSAARRSAPAGSQDEGSYERNLGPIVRDPSVLIGNYCSYVDVHDLCDAVVLAIETDLPGHEVFYIASPDTDRRPPARRDGPGATTTAAGSSSGQLEREDASAISSAKAQRTARLDAAAVVARLPRRERQGPQLRTRRLGSDGPELTTVGFGSWAIGGPWRFGWGPVDDDESVAAIRRAVELGVNWVDTAAVYGYGHSEEVVGRARRAAPPGRGRLRLHQVRAQLVRQAPGRDRERPPAGVDPLRVRAEPAPAGPRAHRPLPVPLARPRDRDAGRGVLGRRWPSSSTRARCAGSGSATSTSSCSPAATPSAGSTRSSRRCRCSDAARGPSSSRTPASTGSA